QDLRSVTTAQLVLDDPGTPQRDDIQTYCIDLSTETTIGIHYKLGTWTAANVPNLPYVEWILDHYFPGVPTAPAGTAAEQVRAVQGAIWYFTDRFVVSTGYPAERAAVRDIVAAAQAAVGSPEPPAPPLPTLTITPPVLTGGASGALVGPFAVGGDVASATIAITGTDVYRDAAGTVPVPDGGTVAPGDQLWARYDAQTVDQGFVLTGHATVAAGNVYLYDGGNPPRTTAQKLVLAAETRLPVRAAAAIEHPDTGTLAVDVVIAGGAAGQQGQVEIVARCDAGLATPISFTRYVPADSAAGTYAFAFAGIPAMGTVCSVTQAADGAVDGIRVSTSIDPASLQLAAGSTRTITVTDRYDPAAPPSPVLPATGVAGGPPLAAALLLLLVGVVVLASRRAP
ncbi:MAG TPA: thioester domain-containing protein, partial [Pseudolysinimonas sp.]|nr:thioester domain-containing protein [Pseudolysinimonas sp.]